MYTVPQLLLIGSGYLQGYCPLHMQIIEKKKQTKKKPGQLSMLLRLSLGFLEFPNKYIYPSPGSEEGKGRGVCAAFIHEKEPALTASHAVIYQLRCLIPIPNSLVSGSQQNCYNIGLVM